MLAFQCGGALVSNPVYRLLQLVQVIECLVAIVSLPLVNCRFIVPAGLHVNLKVCQRSHWC